MTLTLAPYDGAEILARCPQVWGVQTIPYDMGSTDTPTGHRADCSGFASAVLGLPAPGLTTVTLATLGVLVPIGWEQLQPGDFLMIGGPGTEGADGHVAVYTGRQGDGYEVWEQSGGQAGPHQSVWSDPAGEGFLPYRYANNTGGEPMALRDDPDFNALIYRVEAIEQMRDTVLGGEVAGEQVAVVAFLKHIAAGVEALNAVVAKLVAPVVDEAAVEAAAERGAREGIEGATLHSAAG